MGVTLLRFRLKGRVQQILDPNKKGAYAPFFVIYILEKITGTMAGN